MGLFFSIPDMGYAVLILFFYKNSFGIWYPTKVDMPLNKEIKRNRQVVLVYYKCIWLCRNKTTRIKILCYLSEGRSRGIMNIVVGNRYGALGKNMNPTILPRVEQTGHFNLGKTTSLGEGKLDFVLHQARAEGLVNT